MTSPYSTGRRGVQYGGAVSSGGAGALSNRGANDFLALSKRLKAAGAKGLRNDLNKAMRNAAKPLIPKVKAAAAADLPRGGGLNQRIAKKPYRAQTRTGAKTAGVRIVGTKVDPRINDGRVWHPVFGREGKAKNGGRNSVVQNVPAAKGYFTDTLRDATPEIRNEVVAVLKEFAADVTRRGIS